MSFIKEFQHLQILLKDINLATNNFGNDHYIGQGGFGKVYKGELLLSCGRTMVAIKRLDSTLGQGAPEFWKEIMLLSRYKHENLVSLLGFCDESGESILVYEYLSNESLDKHLKGTNLSWKQRLRICIGATQGLQYLHDPNGTQQRVLHRDIKSANILLDQNWNAKISDFGLSKIGPANQQYTYLVSNAVGTFGYCDPLYMKTGCLTKESDIYSLGVVLFEVLCGRFCIEKYEDNRRFLANLAQRCYEEKKLDTIISSSLKEQISQDCLERFSAIAYQCLQTDHTKRPVVADIVKELEIALQYQVEYEFEKEKELKRDVVLESESDEYWDMKLPRDWEIIVKKLNIPRAIYTIKKELFSYLHKGILFDESNKFFWINNDGKKCMLISARRFLTGRHTTWVFQRDYLRFSRVAEFSYGEFHDIKCQIKTSMLSLGTMYAASLVFKYDWQPNEVLQRFRLITFKWKTEELSVSTIHFAELSVDNWYVMKMWHFINHVPEADFDIVIEELSYFGDSGKSDILILGIEFQPIEMMQHEEIEEFNSLSTSEEVDTDEDVYWEKMLPNDYQRCIEASDKPLNYTNKKELYFILCAGFLGYSGKLWLSLCKSTGGICSMLSASEILGMYIEFDEYDEYFEGERSTLSLADSRFSQVKKLQGRTSYSFECRLRSPMFSPQHIYSCYLVFKFPDNIQFDTCLLEAECILDSDKYTNFVYLYFNPPNIPTIKPKNDYGSHGSSYMPRLPKNHMRHIYSTEQRNDGWIEVILCKSLKQLENKKSLVVRLKSKDRRTYGIIVEGIEFRPMQGCI